VTTAIPHINDTGITVKVGIFCAVVRYFAQIVIRLKYNLKPSFTTVYVVTDGVEFLKGLS